MYTLKNKRIYADIQRHTVRLLSTFAYFDCMTNVHLLLELLSQLTQLVIDQS